MIAHKNNKNRFGMKSNYKKLGNQNSKVQSYWQIWIRVTVFRVMFVAFIGLIIATAQKVGFEGAKIGVETIKQRLDQERTLGYYVEEIKVVPEYIKSFGNKAIEAIKIDDVIKGGFIPPVNGEITTYFNEEIENTSYISNGIIFSSQEGVDILAVDDGVVINVGSNEEIGNYIVMKHKGELLSIYKFVKESFVDIDQNVSVGSKIGIAGERLLFEVWFRNEAIDPMKYINIDIQEL